MWPASRPSSLVATAVDRIESNRATPLSVEQLCEDIGVAKRTLHRRFQSELGVTPLDHIRLVKPDLAKTLLATTALSFETITAECGYEDVPSFHRLFARKVGISPGAYRVRFAA